MTPVAWETLDEIDMVALEADIRKRLAYYTGKKINHVLYTALDDAALDSAYDWQTGKMDQH